MKYYVVEQTDRFILRKMPFVEKQHISLTKQQKPILPSQKKNIYEYIDSEYWFSCCNNYYHYVAIQLGYGAVSTVFFSVAMFILKKNVFHSPKNYILKEQNIQNLLYTRRKTTFINCRRWQKNIFKNVSKCCFPTRVEPMLTGLLFKCIVFLQGKEILYIHRESILYCKACFIISKDKHNNPTKDLRLLNIL